MRCVVLVRSEQGEEQLQSSFQLCANWDAKIRTNLWCSVLFMADVDLGIELTSVNRINIQILNHSRGQKVVKQLKKKINNANP